MLNYDQLYLKVPQMPVDFISIELIGPFEVPSKVISIY